MNHIKNILKIIFLSFVTFSMSACQINNTPQVKVILEDGDFKCGNKTLVLDKGSDFTFSVTLDINKIIVGASYENYSISETLDNLYRYDKITFHNVNYSEVISLTINEAAKITYQGNEKNKEEYVNKTHERINTNNDYEYFKKDGYSLIGWSNGEEIISLGSRVSVSNNLKLNAIYEKESDVSLFNYEIINNSRIKITKYLGNEDKIIIPSYIDDKAVISIGEDSFNNLNISLLVLPRSLSMLEEASFSNCQIDALVFFDNLLDVYDSSFLNSSIDQIRINAISGPAYIRTYYGTYADKVDRLISLKDKKKIILYSGSSTRFGFDSELIDNSFLDYDVVNMGVFAYTVSYPQVDVISHLVKENDLVVVSPEFDAIDKQINLLPDFDSDFIAMIESNYDIISLLDFSKYNHFFNAFKEYQYNRRNIARYSYIDTLNSYDEDGNLVNSPSYNRYGDYVVYRKNNEEMKSFGVKRAFYNKKYFPKEYLVNFNYCFSLLRDKKVSLYYDYSPRMDISISEDSNKDTANELDVYLKDNIEMEFISSAGDSLMSPLYFYGTDNHLSTEGVNIRTRRVISQLLRIVNN